MTKNQEKNIPLTTFGHRVKFIRESMGLNQSQLAELIGLKQSFISKVEKGNANFTTDQIISFKTIFGIDANWLLAGEGDVTGGRWKFAGTESSPSGITIEGAHVKSDETRYEDPIQAAFLSDWLKLSDVVKMRIWTLVKEELEKQRGSVKEWF